MRKSLKIIQMDYLFTYNQGRPWGGAGWATAPGPTIYGAQNLKKNYILYIQKNYIINI